MGRPFKIILKLLKWVGTTLVVLSAAVGGLLWWKSLDKMDAKFIPNSEFQAGTFEFSSNSRSVADERLAIEGFDKLESPVYLSNFHWIRSGDKTMFIIRKFSPGKAVVIDDEHFTQASVAVPKVEVGTFKIDNQEIRGFFTKGGSAWPRGQCGRAIDNGTLVISKVSNASVEATIKFEIECVSAFSDRTEKIVFNETHAFKRLSFGRAGSWHGKHGKNVYSETYR